MEENKLKAKAKELFSARNLVYLAVLLALVVVLQAVGGTIAIGPVSLNFTLIPIALGAILLGVWGGAFLGFACGLVVLIQVIVGAGFYAIIWTGSPVITTITCLAKTTVAGAIAGVAYKGIAKKNKLAAVFVSAGLVPVINTLLFILGCLCMGDVLTGAFGVSGGQLLVFILVSLVTYNFFIEFAINLLLSPALHRVVVVVEKQIGKKKKKPEAVEEAPAEEEIKEPIAVEDKPKEDEGADVPKEAGEEKGE